MFSSSAVAMPAASHRVRGCVRAPTAPVAKNPNQHQTATEPTGEKRQPRKSRMSIPSGKCRVLATSLESPTIGLTLVLALLNGSIFDTTLLRLIDGRTFLKILFEPGLDFESLKFPYR